MSMSERTPGLSQPRRSTLPRLLAWSACALLIGCGSKGDEPAAPAEPDDPAAPSEGAEGNGPTGAGPAAEKRKSTRSRKKDEAATTGGLGKNELRGAAASIAQGPGAGAQRPGFVEIADDKPAKPAPDNTPVDAPVTLDAALVEAFVTQWAARWNKQDADGWSALYAKRFVAVERAGTRLLRYDRTRWMRRRLPALRRGARWKLESVRVTVVADVAVVEAERSSTTGKVTAAQGVRLVIAPAAAVAGSLKATDLRILREEDLGRTPSQFALGAQPVDRERFAFVVDAGGPWVVLGSAPTRGVTGAPRLETRRSPTVGGVVSASREIPLATMPPALRRWAGREVSVLDEAGQQHCTAELGVPRALARVVAPEPLVKTWRGERAERASSDQIAASVWKLTEGRHLLAARLSPMEGSCDRGRFVIAAGGSRPAIVPPKPVPLTSMLGKAAIKALRDKAGYKLHADAFAVEAPKTKGPWEAAKGGSLTLHRFDAPAGSSQPSWLLARAAYGQRCDAFNARFVALWEIGEGESLTPRSDEDDGGPFLTPRFAADLDGEGQPEIVGDHHLFRRTGKYVVEQESVTPAVLDAVCTLD